MAEANSCDKNQKFNCPKLMVLTFESDYKIVKWYFTGSPNSVDDTWENYKGFHYKRYPCISLIIIKLHEDDKDHNYIQHFLAICYVLLSVSSIFISQR